MKLNAEIVEFERFLATASVFWRNNLPSKEGDRWIIVEAMHPDIRVPMRTLTIANALRRIVPARLLVITGTDPAWREVVWKTFDLAEMRRLCEAFAATEILDVHELAARFMAVPPGEPPGGPPGEPRGESPGRPPGAPPGFTIGDRELTVHPAARPHPSHPFLNWSSIDPDTLDAFAEATACRLKLTPRLTAGYRRSAEFLHRRRLGAAFSAIYETLCRELDPVALVTSHVDYDQWGLAVESALRFDVPVLHIQSTGAQKVYALFPETRTGEATVRAELTRQIGTLFERHVWPNRELIRPSAELVTWRSRSNLGRPSWWRGGAISVYELRNPTERRQIREYAMARLRLDPTRPVVTVFNHAVSDALGTNREIFPDLAAWFESTVRYAAARPDTNWLFLEHPSQIWYDSTGFFDDIAQLYAGHPRMAFQRSAAMSKNALWSLTDLGVTVRGSVSNELPAFGTPVIQAGWSEWSSCGLSIVAADQDEYWKTLDASIEALVRGEALIEPEQIERARLWSWFYRSASDVPSPIAPHWDVRPEDVLLNTLRTNMRLLESDGDPLFAAVERMWTGREPVMTRFDLSRPEHLARLIPPIRECDLHGE